MIKMKPLHENLHETHTFKVYGYKTYRNDNEDFIQLKQTFCDYMQSKLEEFGNVDFPNYFLDNFIIKMKDEWSCPYV